LCLIECLSNWDIQLFEAYEARRLNSNRFWSSQACAFWQQNQINISVTESRKIVSIRCVATGLWFGEWPENQIYRF